MKLFLLIITIILLSACSDPITVVVPAPHGVPNAMLVFDGSDTLVMSGPVDSIRLGSSAEHTCTTADGRSITFRVGDRSGLLNLDSSAFVVFSIDYQAKHAGTQGPKIIVGHVLVDSFLVYRKPFPNDHMDDATALRIAGILKEKGNYAEAVTPFGRRPLKTYATSKDVAGVRWIGPGQPFVERYWNIDLGHDIPTSITGQVQQGMEHIDTERRLICIKPAKEFLFFANLFPDRYEVIDLRKLGRPE